MGDGFLTGASQDQSEWEVGAFGVSQAIPTLPPQR